MDYHIIDLMKGKAIFDQFRKDCITDADIQPTYINLRSSVDKSVTDYLNHINWSSKLAQISVRDGMKKHIVASSNFDKEVNRIVNQIVDPKVTTVFLPVVETLIYDHLGVPKSIVEKIDDDKICVNEDMDVQENDNESRPLTTLNLTPSKATRNEAHVVETNNSYPAKEKPQGNTKENSEDVKVPSGDVEDSSENVQNSPHTSHVCDVAELKSEQHVPVIMVASETETVELEEDVQLMNVSVVSTPDNFVQFNPHKIDESKSVSTKNAIIPISDASNVSFTMEHVHMIQSHAVRFLDTNISIEKQKFLSQYLDPLIDDKDVPLLAQEKAEIEAITLPATLTIDNCKINDNMMDWLQRNGAVMYNDCYFRNKF